MGWVSYKTVLFGLGRFWYSSVWAGSVFGTDLFGLGSVLVQSFLGWVSFGTVLFGLRYHGMWFELALGVFWTVCRYLKDGSVWSSEGLVLLKLVSGYFMEDVKLLRRRHMLWYTQRSIL